MRDDANCPPPSLTLPRMGGGNGPEQRRRAALYRLMTWLSPSYPVGAFSYSSGIEWAVEAGDITDAATLSRLAVADDERRRGLLRCGSVRARASRGKRQRRCGTSRCRGTGRGVFALEGAASGDDRAGRAPFSRRPARPGRARRWICWRRHGMARSPIRSRSATACAGHGIAVDIRFARFPACGCRQLDFRRRPADPARPDRRAARAGGARNGHRRDRNARARIQRSTISAARRSAPISRRCATRPNIRGCSDHDQKSQRPPARRHRRSGRLRQDRADGCAVQEAARQIRDRGDHQRHLHQVGCRISGALRRARRRTHRRRRDRRLSAYGDPRGCLDQSRRRRRHARALSANSIWC